MIDLYTKAVLTVIAGSLAILAGSQILPTPANALGDGCGDRSMNACYVTLGIETVTIQSEFPLPVRVMN